MDSLLVKHRPTSLFIVYSDAVLAYKSYMFWHFILHFEQMFLTTRSILNFFLDLRSMYSLPTSQL